MRKGLALAAVVVGLSAAYILRASAATYPSHVLTRVVPYPAGGGVDLVGRLVGQELSAALGQQVIVENRGGAGGMIGTRDIAHAAPDGYKIGRAHV